MATAQLFHGTVKFAAGIQPMQTTNGPRINVVITLDSGEDIKLWDNPGAAIQHLKKGQRVTLTHDGKRYLLIATSPASNGNGQRHPTPGAIAQATPAMPPAAPPSQEPESADVQEWVALFEEIRAALPNASETTWRAAANNLFSIRCRIRDEFAKDF